MTLNDGMPTKDEVARGECTCPPKIVSHEEKLKPCPFCGRSEAYISSYDSHNNVRVFCPCGVLGLPAYNSKEAREAWNTRYEDSNSRKS